MSTFSTLTNIDNTFAMEDYEQLLSEETNPNKEQQLESLQAMAAALESIDFESQIKFLDTLAQHDDSVRQMIGFDDSQYLVNFKRQVDLAEEGFWQDLLRWGPLGAIMGFYLHSFTRIRKCCKAGITDGIDQSAMDNWTARSLYLPDQKDFAKIVSGLNTLYAGLKRAANNLDKFKPMDLAPALKGTGIQISEANVKGTTKIDWKAIGGSFIGGFAAGLIFRSLASFISVPVTILGAHMASDNGGRLGDRGWNAANLTQACKDMLKLIEQATDLSSIKADVNTEAGASTSDIGSKVKFVQKACKVYCEDVKTIGRGLASAVYHVKN